MAGHQIVAVAEEEVILVGLIAAITFVGVHTVNSNSDLIKVPYEIVVVSAEIVIIFVETIATIAILIEVVVTQIELFVMTAGLVTVMSSTAIFGTNIGHAIVILLIGMFVKFVDLENGRTWQYVNVFLKNAESALVQVRHNKLQLMIELMSELIMKEIYGEKKNGIAIADIPIVHQQLSQPR